MIQQILDMIYRSLVINYADTTQQNIYCKLKHTLFIHIMLVLLMDIMT